MKNAPAFQFYPSDFVGGTMGCTAEQCGAYILLLCYQWMNGYVPDDMDEIESITRVKRLGLIWVMRKFPKSKTDGLLRNQKLEQVRQRQIEYREKQRENGQKGGRPRKPSLTQAYPKPNPSQSSLSLSPSLEREQSFPEVNGRPTLIEILETAKMIGLAEWKAKDWFDEMQGCGWLDHAHRPIQDWRYVLSRVRTKWESDGRPSSPPKPRNSPSRTEKPPLNRNII